MGSHQQHQRSGYADTIQTREGKPAETSRLRPNCPVQGPTNGVPLKRNDSKGRLHHQAQQREA